MECWSLVDRQYWHPVQAKVKSDEVLQHAEEALHRAEVAPIRVRDRPYTGLRWLPSGLGIGPTQG